MFNDFFDWLADRAGYISKEDYMKKPLSEGYKKKTKRIAKLLGQASTYANPARCFELANEAYSAYREELATNTKFQKRAKTIAPITGYADLYGFKPATSKILGIFADNPYGAYAFIARYHPAVRSCIDVILAEIANDGIVLISEKGTTKKKLKDLWQRLKKDGVFTLRRNICKHLKLYGNCWMLPQTNGFGGITQGDKSIFLMSPPRVIPDLDLGTEQIIGWYYKPNSRGYIKLPLDKVWHLMVDSVDDYLPLGDPPLGPAIVSIETALNAINFNNQIFQKGGLMGLIISLKQVEGDDPFDEDADEIAAEELQERIETQFSGGKTGLAPIVTSGIDQVVNANPIGQLGQSFKDTLYETAKTIAVCLGIPPEKISVSRSETLQYIPSLVEDSVNTQFDKMLNELTEYVDEFINEKIIKERYGITDIRIQAGGRYGSLTKNAADVIKTLADAGPVITVNEALEKVLGWEPLPPNNPRGQYVLDNTVNRDIDAIPMIVDPEKPNLDLGKLNSEKFLKMAYEIKAGTFERKEKTYDSEDSFCHVAIIKNKRIKFYEENRKEN